MTWDRINCPQKEETLLKIITWKNGLFTSRVGRVTKIDRYAKKIKILDKLDSEFTLNFFDIIDVKLK
ncbi:YolD-like family protein [Neobacillus drentensis]|uniref:YolD-like family protein n=1 Tax=Neobacillus drentensis TaxID=220684 RepID=UPI003B587843